MAHIYQPLVNHFREIFDTPRELVCIGDRHFTPGRSIYHEIHRCLEISAVIITVVSNEFCQSQYCVNELEQAYDLGKPILMIFVDMVDENEMTPIMRQLFKRYTRVNMRIIDGEVQIVPCWDRICRSILEMLPR
jgi:hypothetical protein